MRAAVRSWVRPGSAGDSHRISPARVRDDPHVHAVPLVFRGVVGPAVADAVALRERAVQEGKVRLLRAQRLQQARRLLGEQTGDRGDVGVGGTDGYSEGRGDTGEGIVAAQVHECDQRTAVRREFAPPAPSRVTMSIVTHSTKAWGRPSAAGYGTNRASVLPS